MSLPSLPLQDELTTAAFFALLYFSDKACVNVLRVPGLLGQVMVGVLLGPAWLNIVPYASALELLGRLGLYCMVVESSMSIEFQRIRAAALWSFFAAVAGLVGPILFAFLAVYYVFGAGWKTALAVGAAIAPTSFGFSAGLFMEAGHMQTSLAVIACTAAVLDDVLSLVLMSEIGSLEASGPVSAWTYGAPVVGCVGSIIIGTVCAVMADGQLHRVEQCFPTSVRSPAMMLVLLAATAGVAILCRLAKTSELLACFLVGMVFSSSSVLRECWPRYTQSLVRWGSALFFGSTIGFSVPPLRTMVGKAAFLRGGAYLLAAIVGKSFLGLFAKPFTWGQVVRFAACMNARGEFNFQIAAQAHEDGVLSNDDYSGVVWSLLVVTLITPVWFRVAFRHPPPPDPTRPDLASVTLDAPVTSGSADADADAGASPGDGAQQSLAGDDIVVECQGTPSASSQASLLA